MPLIDLDTAFEFIDKAYGGNVLGLKNVMMQIPTVDPVKHGYWVICGTLPMKCSVCGFMCGSADYDNADRYCSHCGAKMDEEVSDEAD